MLQRYKHFLFLKNLLLNFLIFVAIFIDISTNILYFGTYSAQYIKKTKEIFVQLKINQYICKTI